MDHVTPGVRVAAWLVALTSLLLVVVGTTIPFVLGEDFDLSADTGILALGLSAPILGLILVLRAGAVRMGDLLIAMGFGLGLASLGAGISHPDFVAWAALVPVANAGWMIFLSLTIAGLPLLFPTGHPPTPRWRPVLWSLLIVLPLVTLMTLFSEQISLSCSDVWPEDYPCSVWEDTDEPVVIGECEATRGPLGEGTECTVLLDNPIGIPGVSDPEEGLFGSVLFGALLLTATLSIVSLGVRFRRADRKERQQIKLVFLVLGIFVAASLLDAVVVDFMGGSLPLMEVIDFVMWIAIPLSIFLAITRYRLYDIDRLISRTLSYAIVVGLLVGLVALLATLIGTQFDDPPVVAGTTLAVAAVFNPLRRRVRGWVDRRFNRSRYDAERVMDDFAGSLRDEVHAQEVVDGWKSVVSDTMQPSSMGVWVRH